MFLSGTDFNVVPYNIPQSEDAANLLGYFIPLKERVCLRSLLGSAFYNEFVSALFEDPSVADADLVAIDDSLIDQKWKDIRDGADYELYGIDYRYDGIVNMLKPYVFSEWVLDNHQTLSANGLMQPKVENGQIVDPSKLIVKYYNEFSQYAGAPDRWIDSLWGYLKANEESFADNSDILFKDPGFKNLFGL